MAKWTQGLVLAAALASQGCGDGHDGQSGGEGAGGWGGFDGLKTAGIEIDPASTVGFSPDYMLATRYEHHDDPQYGDFIQYDLLMVEEGASFAGSLQVHWNYGVPIEDELFELPVPNMTFETPAPTIDRLFLPDGAGNVRLDHGQLAYTPVGLAADELVGLVFDLTFEDGTRFMGKAASPLTVKVVDQQPPSCSG